MRLKEIDSPKGGDQTSPGISKYGKMKTVLMCERIKAARLLFFEINMGGSGMDPGYIRAVCLSDECSIPKRDVGQGYLKEDFGLLGDAHAGPSERQVSILLEQFVEPLTEKLGGRPAPGSFAENLLVSGLSEQGLARGTLIKAGEAVIEITAIGKDAAEKHTYSYQGFSLLAEQGLFGRVLKGGRVKAGDPVEVLEDRPTRPPR